MERRIEKENLKKEWEKCFEMKIEDKLTKEGLEYFWDDNTSEEEAFKLLTRAALDELIANKIADIVGIAVVSKEQCTDDAKQKFMVVRPKDNFFYDVKFDSEKEANDFIKEQAMNTNFTVDDFKVVRVKSNG